MGRGLGRAIWQSLAVASVLLIAKSTSEAQQASLLYKLTAPEGQPGAQFGQVIAAVDGDLVVAEPRRFDPSTGAAGRAYLFDGRSGLLQSTFDNPEIGDEDSFGGQISGGDGRVFISARGLKHRVYGFDAGTGAAVLRIDEPNNSRYSFGVSIAYHDGRLLVSSPAYSANRMLSVGRAQIFDSVSGALIETLENPEPKPADTFGQAVAWSGSRPILGSILDDLPGDTRPGGDSPGRVWVFKSDLATPAFVLENPNPSEPTPFDSSDWFGSPLAASADLIVVGAQEDSSNGVEDSGTVYAFNGQTGSLVHTLYSPRPQENGEFGRSVALTTSGNILVGAFGESVDGIEGAGRAYLFDGQTGALLLDIPNPEPRPFTAFGWSVTAFGERIAVSASQAGDGPSLATGAVYLFDVSEIPETDGLTMAALGGFLFYLVRLTKGASGGQAEAIGGQNGS